MSGQTATSGIDRIEAAFKSNGRSAALMPYLMGGFPTVEISTQIAQAYVDGGADLIELGVPFSDPLADGPVIHQAATAALRAGATVDSVLEVARAVTGQVPVLVMSYFNQIATRGEQEFVDAVADAGCCGLIVPDLPYEESGSLRAVCAAAGLALVPLVAPTTTDHRMTQICSEASGFVYTVSVVGTTGERQAVGEDVAALVGRVRACTAIPVAVGFGIAEPAQAREVAQFADGVIVGTRLVRLVRDVASADGDVAEAVELAVREFADQTRPASPRL